MLEEDYLESCRTSVKYKHGIWYVGYANEQPVTSLILYSFTNYGIGSVATNPNDRGKGYAKQLIQGILEEKAGETIFLYSDIASQFYEKIGFQALELEKQPNLASCLMVYPKLSCIVNQVLPNYF